LTLSACDDGNNCTEDLCEPGTGVCAFVPGPACKWCSNEMDCEDLDACTLDYCDLSLGVCSNLKTDCDDGQCLTDDLCDGSSGECVHIPIPIEEFRAE